MDIRDMQLFLTLSETLHFRITGEICHLSPSAVSRALQRMEQELDQELIHRESRDISLTMAGRIFAEFCREVLSKWHSMERELGTKSGQLHGELRLFASVTASIAVLPRLLARLRTAFPGIRVVLETGAHAEALQRVSDGHADIAVAALPKILPDGLSSCSLLDSDLIFIAPRISVESFDPSRIPDNLTPEAASELPMVVPRDGIAREELMQWFLSDGGGLHPRIYAEVSGSEGILSMVRLGFGIGLVPRIVLESSALSTEVRILKAMPSLEPFHLGLVAQSRRIDEPELSAFWNLGEAGQV